jgi:hypothetical protein
MLSTYPEIYLIMAMGGVALALFFTFSLLSRRYGLSAIRRWANATGLRVVYAKRRTFVPHWHWLHGRRHQFFRVTVQNKEGTAFGAWLCLESDCTTPEIIDIIWDGGNPAGLPDLA